MLENRDYMRTGPDAGPPFGFRWSASSVLMVVLVAAYALQCINDVYFRAFAEPLLGLTPQALSSGYVWQLLTFQFLHGNLMHLVCNLIGLWFFGRFAENVLGRSRFCIAYFGAGVLGGILQAALMWLFPFHFPSPAFGASAGVSGVFAIFAMLESHSEIRWNFILPIRALTLLKIYLVVELFFTIVPTWREMGVAHAAHLGGLLAGIAWVKLGWHQDFRPLPWENLLDRLRQWTPLPGRSRKRELVKASAVKVPPWLRSKPENSTAAPPEEFISREVDPILDKISAHGIQSLTEQERKTLEAARSKMAKR